MSTTREQLLNQFKLFDSHNFSGALVEMGHIYADEKPNFMHTLGLAVGSAVVDVLQELGISVNTMLFVDNYNAKGDIAGLLSSYRSIFCDFDLGPKYTVFESDYAENAYDFIDELMRDRFKSDKNPRIKESNSGIRLHFSKKDKVTLQYSSGHFSCCLLDAICYRHKTQLSPGSVMVTILPDKTFFNDDRLEYSNQQEKTKRILFSAGISVPIFNVYYNTEGKVEVDFDF